MHYAYICSNNRRIFVEFNRFYEKHKRFSPEITISFLTFGAFFVII